MASYGLIQSALNGLPLAIRAALTNAFTELALRLSLVPTATATKSPNFSAWRFDTTTSTTANLEFTIAHGRGLAPSAIVPVLSLTSSGGQLVTLTVTRAADAQRIYLASPSTNASISLMVEF